MMFGKMVSMLTGAPKRKKQPFKINNYINNSGRVKFSILDQLSKKCEEQHFIKLVKYHALIGDGLFPGDLAGQDAGLTQVFTPASLKQDEGPEENENLARAIYPVVKSANSSLVKNVVQIGRHEDNDIVTPDYSLSQKHATIRIDGPANNKFYIKDLGSTNGTLLNGKKLGKKEAELKDMDKIQLGRFYFRFLSPSSLYLKLDIMSMMAQEDD